MAAIYHIYHTTDSYANDRPYSMFNYLSLRPLPAMVYSCYAFYSPTPYFDRKCWEMNIRRNKIHKPTTKPGYYFKSLQRLQLIIALFGVGSCWGPRSHWGYDPLCSPSCGTSIDPCDCLIAIKYRPTLHDSINWTIPTKSATTMHYCVQLTLAWLTIHCIAIGVLLRTKLAEL
jgi:hypothetical protein